MKRHLLEVLNKSYSLMQSYEYLLLSHEEYNFERIMILRLFKEIIREEAIKKGGNGSNIIEELLLLCSETNLKSGILTLSKEYVEEIKEFIELAKEKGFNTNSVDCRSGIYAECLYIAWRDFIVKKVCVVVYNYYVKCYFL